MALERWDPFRELLTMPYGATTEQAAVLPVDVSETDDEYVVTASLPGVGPEDIEVTVRGNLLTIRSRAAREVERRGRNWILHERRVQAFYRTVTLPGPVDLSRAEARFENGVLTLRLPKAAEVNVQHIKVGAQPQQVAAPAPASAGERQAPAMGQPQQAGQAPQAAPVMQVGMEVVGADGGRVGRVKEARDSDFLVDRPMARDVYVPFDAVQSVSGNQVRLSIPASQIDSMGWPSPPL